MSSAAEEGRSLGCRLEGGALGGLEEQLRGRRPDPCGWSVGAASPLLLVVGQGRRRRC
jgi:hypothetical protein